MEDANAPRRYRVVLTDLEIARANIVNLLAFSQCDFLPEKLADLRTQLAAANLSQSILVEWRKWFIRADYGDTSCGHCEEDVTLDFAELVAAEFTCPLCRTRQSVDFRRLKPTQDFAHLSNLTDHFLPEVDNLFLDASTLPETTSDDALIRLLDRVTLHTDQTTLDRIICRLALRGVTYDRFVQIHDNRLNHDETLPPLNNLGLAGEATAGEDSRGMQVAVDHSSKKIEEPAQPPTSESDLLQVDAGSPMRDTDTQRFAAATSPHQSSRSPQSIPRESANGATMSQFPAGGGTRVLIFLSALSAALLFIRFAPPGSMPSRLFQGWFGGFVSSQPTPHELTVILGALAVLSGVVAISVASWLIAAHRFLERLGGPSMDFSAAAFLVALPIPVLPFPLYYRVARVVEDQVRSNQTQLKAVDLASTARSSSIWGGLRRAAANPSLLLLFGLWSGFVAYAIARGSVNLSAVWWYLLPLQVCLLFLCDRYVGMVSRLSREGSVSPAFRS